MEQPGCKVRLQLIGHTVLDQDSSPAQLRDALEDFLALCAEQGGVVADPCFDAWSGDALLQQGVAISPAAAAHCVRDYRRTVVYTRALYAAIKRALIRFPDARLQVLYAGCGPYASLLLPVIQLFEPGQLELHLLDYHQESLDCVAQILAACGLDLWDVQLVQADACLYQHPAALHVVIAETMQKSLEQEPQFAVTANLAPQCVRDGLFLPQMIQVSLSLIPKLAEERGSTGQHDQAPTDRQIYPVLILSPDSAAQAEVRALRDVSLALPVEMIALPELLGLSDFNAQYIVQLQTRIHVFGEQWLLEGEAEITLPMPVSVAATAERFDQLGVQYRLGSYPAFSVKGCNAS